MRVAFEAPSVARAYACRPPYPEQAVERLLGFLPGAPRVVLDAGCGPGKIARALVGHVDRVDAVDPSEAMLAEASALPGGSDPRIRWQRAAVEEAALEGPYGLVVAGASVHWFDLDVALPKLAAQLHPDGRIALLDGDQPVSPAWEADELDLYMSLTERRTGARPDIRRPRDEVPRILEHHCFDHEASEWLEAFPFEQSIEQYIECQQSRASLSRETLGPDLTAVLVRELRRLLEPHAEEDRLRFSVRFLLEWGRLRRDG